MSKKTITADQVIDHLWELIYKFPNMDVGMGIGSSPVDTPYISFYLNDGTEIQLDITIRPQQQDKKGECEMSNLSKLPEHCFVVLKTTDEVVMVTRGQMGYSPTREDNLPWYGQEIADALNSDRGITKAQAKAMEMGSMFGWEIPAADPDKYDEEGRMK